MNIEKYKDMSEDIKISNVALNGYRNAMDIIKSKKYDSDIINEVIEGDNKEKNDSSKIGKVQGLNYMDKSIKSISTLPRIAAIVVVFLVLSSCVGLSVRAYISHMERLKNMDNEKIIDLYENVFQYDSKYMSREMSQEEEVRYSELYHLYCEDKAEAEGEIAIIEDSAEYLGRNLAFCKADGILYLPEKEMSDEQILQMIVFNLLESFVDYESYTKANNPMYYMNNLEKMTMDEVDDIYIAYFRANTEVSFFTRDLTFSEMGRRKVLKDLYKKGLKTPKESIKIVDEVGMASDDDVFFSSSNCTYYLPVDELNDEQLLELIDFQIKVDYCLQRVEELEGHQEQLDALLKELRVEKREPIITIDSNLEVSEGLLLQPWIIAYAKILEQYFSQNKDYYDEPERYYANVCFIYLNNDEIPEMLFSKGYIDGDYNDCCNKRTYLYTYKNNEAILLSPGEDTIDDFYGYEKAFSYVEKKGMVYCDYYYMYGLSKYNDATGIIDNVNDNMSRMDIWDLDTLTCYSSNANMKILHAFYDYQSEEYMDADFSYEYYINVSDIVRDDMTGDVIKIVGEKVDEAAYEIAEKKLWDGETAITLQVSDFDKIYSNYNLGEALAKSFTIQCLMK